MQRISINWDQNTQEVSVKVQCAPEMMESLRQVFVRNDLEGMTSIVEDGPGVYHVIFANAFDPEDVTSTVVLLGEWLEAHL